MKKYVLEVTNLSKSFNGNKVVDDVSFQVEAGDVFGFLGPNGAGKTTIIRMILNLIHSDSGTVRINGYNMKKDFEKAIKSVGAIVEKPSFHEYLSAHDNLVQIANLHPEISKERVAEVLDFVGLKDRASDKVKTYSLGMKQRLGIAMALINKPSIVFLDEPTNGLDPQGVIEIRQLIGCLAQEQGITFFITTHVLHEVEQVCNKVAILKKGKLIAQDYVASLLNREKEIIQVHTHHPHEASNLLKKVEFINRIEDSSYGLRIEINKGSVGELNKLLVFGGIGVDYIVPENLTLEQFFIEITGGNKNV